jgi:hypothetical protein
MYVQCNTEAYLHNHGCQGKAKSIDYPECVSALLLQLSGTQIASSVCSIVICGVSGSIAFISVYLINGMIFRKKVVKIKCAF